MIRALKQRYLILVVTTVEREAPLGWMHYPSPFNVITNVILDDLEEPLEITAGNTNSKL
jgi:hypothetical protein